MKGKNGRESWQRRRHVEGKGDVAVDAAGGMGVAEGVPVVEAVAMEQLKASQVEYLL